MPQNGYSTAPFGLAPFGFWSPEVTPDRNRTRVNARKLDPITRAPIIENGAFVADDPVRQRVLLAIRTTLGSIPGLEDFGSGLSKIKVIDERFPARVRSAVSLALQGIQEIELLEIDPNPEEILIEYRIKRTGEQVTINF